MLLGRKIRKVLTVTLVAGLIVSTFYFSLRVKPEYVEYLTRKIGFAGPVFVLLFIVLGHVFTPLSIVPGIVVGIKLYGYIGAMIILYLACLTSASINFFLARKFGAKVVVKFVGERTFKDINEFAKVAGDKLLLLSRLFGFCIFDLVSYAFGFTSISYKKYIAYTAVLTWIPIAIASFLFSIAGVKGLVIWLVPMLIIGAIFSRYVYKSYVEQKEYK